MSTSDDDSASYRKPPKNGQFKPGQSGNPKGRPKGSRNIANILEEALDRKVSVVENGKRLRISKRELAVSQLVNQAAKGDHKAFQTIARIQSSTPGQPGDASVPVASQSEIPEEQYRETLERWFGDIIRKGTQP